MESLTTYLHNNLATVRIDVTKVPFSPRKSKKLNVNVVVLCCIWKLSISLITTYLPIILATG